MHGANGQQNENDVAYFLGRLSVACGLFRGDLFVTSLKGEKKPQRRWLDKLLSLASWRFWLLLALLFGGVVGLGIFTFAYAEGASYLLDDPNACVNCHIMQDVFDRWNHGTHKAVATCNDCHTPHTFPAKYVIKGINGFNHSVAFTLDNFHEPIQITELNRDVAYENCLYCHGSLTDGISHTTSDEPTDCLRCHAGVGHSR
jgi:cytochrome c nitrite reductase small subunit